MNCGRAPAGVTRPQAPAGTCTCRAGDRPRVYHAHQALRGPAENVELVGGGRLPVEVQLGRADFLHAGQQPHGVVVGGAVQQHVVVRVRAGRVIVVVRVVGDCVGVVRLLHGFPDLPSCLGWMARRRVSGTTADVDHTIVRHGVVHESMALSTGIGW